MKSNGGTGVRKAPDISIMSEEVRAENVRMGNHMCHV